MKRITAIMILVLAFVNVWADESSILKFNYEMEIGYLPLNSWMIHDTEYTGKGLDFYLTLKAELMLFDFIFVGGSMKSDVSFRGDGLNCDPSDIWYSVDVGFRFGGFEIGWRHMCIHPIMTYLRTTVWGASNAEGAYEEIYISFKGSVKLF